MDIIIDPEKSLESCHTIKAEIIRPVAPPINPEIF
jgi:hypothetical protein